MKRIFQGSKTIMYRIPFKSESFKDINYEMEEYIYSLAKDTEFCEQLLIASPSLYETLIHNKFNKLKSNKRKNFLQSLLSYINRAATRTTPFGLFTSVGLSTVRNSVINDKKFLNKNLFKKKSRIDIEWLFKIVKNIETKHFKELQLQINNGIYHIGTRAYLAYNTDSHTNKVSINITRPFVLIENLFQNQDRATYDQLLNLLKKEYPNRDDKTFHSFLETLIEKEFLFSTLRPPIVNTDELEWVINELDKLGDIAYFFETKNRLLNVKKHISDYNTTNFGLGIEEYKQIKTSTDTFHDINSKSFLQVDSEITEDIPILDEFDLHKIEEFASFLHELSKFNQVSFLEEFKMRFLERYGEYIEVPLYELLDENLGIGSPMNYNNPINKYITPIIDLKQRTKLDSYLINKYIDAIQNNKEIILDEDEIKQISIDQTEKFNCPDSLELNFIVKINDGKKTFYLGPNIGSNFVNKTFGRFSYNSDKVLRFIKKNDNRINTQKNISCELSYIPKNVRSANVTRNHSEKSKNLTIHTSSYDTSNKIKLNNILIGIKNNRFYIKDKESNNNLTITSNNMLNPMIGDNGLRLLQDISLQDSLEWSNFPWTKIYEDFSYIPRIRYKGFIIETEFWKINSFLLNISKKPSYEEFIDAFHQFRIKKAIPDKFYLQNADNRILIDCNYKLYEELLYKKFKQQNELSLKGLEEGENFLYSNDGQHPIEIVVPLYQNILKNTKEENNNFHLIKTNQFDSSNTYSPLNGWLFYKVYGDVESENDFLSYINYFEKNEIQDISIQCSYFMRYSDPFPHIRYRIKAEKENLIQFMIRFNLFLDELKQTKIISKYVIDNYVPEIERYGGKYLMSLAEAVFEEDSGVVYELLQHTDVDKEMLGVVTFIHYLENFKIPYEKQILLLKLSNGNANYLEEFKKRKKEFIEEIDPYNSWKKFLLNESNKSILNILSKRVDKVNVYAQKLLSSDELTNSIEDVILSVIHLHFNRLFGVDREFEKKIHFYVLQILKGQKFKRKVIEGND